MVIGQLSTLGENYRQDAMRLFVDNFSYIFSGMTKDRQVLLKILEHCWDFDNFYVMLDGEKLAGFLAVSDIRRRAIVLPKKILIEKLGQVRGRTAAFFFRRFMGKPVVTNDKELYLEYVAVSDDYRRRGIAGDLTNYVGETLGYTHLVLSVLESNYPSRELCKKQGFESIAVKRHLLARMAGFSPEIIMRKPIEK